MNHKNLVIVFIALQILVLGSFIVRYELLKATGTTIYMPLRGYDPTDIFRGDYVNLAYELPYEGTPASYSYWEKQYLIPEIEGKNVTKIQQITTTKPESGIYFQIKNWFLNQTEDFTITNASGVTLMYHSTICAPEFKVWDSIIYTSWDRNNSDTISQIMKQDPQLKTDLYYETWKTGKILTAEECTGTYRFQTTATDRWFVPEGEGIDLEKKIREGNMYAEWKLGGNGAVIITGIMKKNEIGK